MTNWRDTLTLSEALYLASHRVVRIMSLKQILIILCVCGTTASLYWYWMANYKVLNTMLRSVQVDTGLLSADDNELLQYIGKYLDVKIAVIQNQGSQSILQLTLTNLGSLAIPKKLWNIYFHSIRPVISEEPMPHRATLHIEHLKGYLYRISIGRDAFPMLPGKSLQHQVIVKYFILSRFDFFPNWYVAVEGYKPVIIKSTADERLQFVGELTNPDQFKRDVLDTYQPYTPEQRYKLNARAQDLGRPGSHVIPTPLHQRITEEETLEIVPEMTVIIYDSEFKEEAKLLSDKIGVNLQTNQERGEFVIKVITGNVTLQGGQGQNDEEAYRLDISPQRKAITVTARTCAGAFYGIQSLIMLLTDAPNGYKFPGTIIQDSPRFSHRGFQVDVSRNFIKKKDIYILLDAMARYKMNKFHFHLSDDEGWRLQIPGLEELTQIGASRCHDLAEEMCLLPQLGSGPHKHSSGSGYYTTEDYRDILRYADKRHIQVIPEFDMPGHARAATKAMEIRYRLLNRTSPDSASKYLLSDPRDQSEYTSVQNYNDNALNPCLESTYRFLRHLISTLTKLHHGIQPLTIYHFGGDEVARNTWTSSQACTELQRKQGVTDFKQYFVQRLTSLAYSEGLSIGSWEDGVMSGEPIKKEKLKVDVYGMIGSNLSYRDVYVNAWQDILESDSINRAHKLANAGYKVIMSQASHLYFDHPYEPDPEERGLYWATRYTDLHKVFGFMLDHLYANTYTDKYGNLVTKEQLCSQTACIPLLQKDNIVGIEGHLWTEMVRTSNQFYYMIFPRLLALAERAWHKAPWEDITEKSERKSQMEKDWTNFTNTLGYRELQVLDTMKISYRLPLPGAVKNNGNLLVNIGIPGLPVQYSTDDGQTWSPVMSGPIHVGHGQVLLRTSSPDGQRFSRPVVISS